RTPPPRGDAAAPIATAPASDTEVEALAAIEEMEVALEMMPRLLAFLDVPADGGSIHGERLPRQPVAERTFFTPACTLANTEAVQQALKGALAATICGVIYTALNQ